MEIFSLNFAMDFSEIPNRIHNIRPRIQIARHSEKNEKKKHETY